MQKGKHFIGIYILVLLILFFTACRKDVAIQEPLLDVPSGFPIPLIPKDNPLTKEKIALGKQLFFDPILSKDSSISCASCHKPELAFTDGLMLAKGINGKQGKRNTQSLLNVAYEHNFFREGSAKTLELQVLAPLTAENEMGSSLPEVILKLNRNAEYKRLFKQVFEKEPDIYGLTRALAAFERTLIDKHSRFDEYYLLHNKKALSAQEINGFNLFFSDKTQCGSCHNTFYLSNQELANTGLYKVYADSGYARLTGLAEDIGKFKVPSLRNLKYTAPYMHNGSLQTLEEVIQHYKKGGEHHPNQHAFIKGFSLNDEEQKELIAFLLTL